jgi:hypothetical protein
MECLRNQNSDFTGMRRWLLLYRPEGIEGWIFHSLFYLCALSALVLKIRGVMAAVGAVHGSSVWLAPIYFTSASLFVMFMFRLRAISLRLSKHSDQRLRKH